MNNLAQLSLFQEIGVVSNPVRKHREKKHVNASEKSLDRLVASTGQNASRIGWIFWYCISNKPSDKDVVNEAFLESGLPSKYKLPEIRPADAYRRASKSIEKRIDLPQNGLKLDLLVRDVWHNKNEIVRYLVIENRDLLSHKLSYETQAAILKFDHVMKDIDVETDNSEPYVLDALRMFENNFRLFRSTYDDSAKRRAVRNVLDDLAAVSLKESGGVYLVPRENEELMFQLIAFVNALPNCRAYKMPVEDTAESRDMVREVVTSKAETILGEIRAALRAEVPNEQYVQELLEKARRIKHEVVTYQNVLKESIGTLETDVEVLEVQMVSLIEQQL